MDFGDKLRSAREEAGMTQKQLADLIGVSAWTICNWEKKESIDQISEQYKEIVEAFIEDYMPEDEISPEQTSKCVIAPEIDAETVEKIAEEIKKSDVAILPPIEETQLYRFSVITNAGRWIDVVAEMVKVSRDPGLYMFRTAGRMVAAFRISEVLGIVEEKEVAR